MTTETASKPDLWRDHSERYDAILCACDPAFEKLSFGLSPLEKHAVEEFLDHVSDVVADTLEDQPDIEEWVEEAVRSFLAETQTLALFLAAHKLDNLVSRDESMGYGILGQALQRVIDQLLPIVKHREPLFYENITAWGDETL